MAFTIPSTLQASYFEMADSLLVSDMTSSVCTIHYPPQKTECINCTPGAFGHTNQYRVGGPIPFSFGVCPACQGSGAKDVETTENVRLRIYISNRKFQELPENFEDFSGYIIGFNSDLEKVRKANYIEIISKNTLYHLLRFKLASQPVPWGFGKSRYFRCDISR